MALDEVEKDRGKLRAGEPLGCLEELEDQQQT